MESAIFNHNTPKGETVNSDSYYNLLCSLNIKIRSKSCDTFLKGVILVHDNT